MAESNKNLCTVKQMMARFQVSEKTIYRWVHSGQIEAIQAGRFLRFEEAEIKRFMDLRRRARNRQASQVKPGTKVAQKQDSRKSKAS
jgi:excisionase family DNA binding protein